MSGKENIVEAVVEETVIEETIIERPYTLRKLKDGDLIPLLSILRKLGLKEYKQLMISVADGNGSAKEKLLEVGVDGILAIGDLMISKLEGEAGNAIYDFYSSLSGLAVEEIKELEFGTMPLMIYDSLSEVKNTSFFKVLAKLL